MRTRRVGQSGLRVSEIGLGSWLTLGSAVDERASARLVEHAFDLGVNFFDTADVYANGRAESALGRALTGLPRHHVVIGSKCFFPMSDQPNDRGLSRKHVCESVEGSLRRLGTDYIDLYQCHRFDPDTPVEETVRAFSDLIRQGKLLYWGVSLWSGEQIREACRIADASGGVRPISNQPQYSIVRRRIEIEVIAACEATGLGQLVFSPLGQGVLTGKYGAGARPGDSRAADPQSNFWMDDYLEPELLQRIDRLPALAEKLGISAAQLAIAWCLRQPNVACAIVGASRPEQLSDNAGASGVELPADVLDEIDSLFPVPAPDADD